MAAAALALAIFLGIVLVFVGLMRTLESEEEMGDRLDTLTGVRRGPAAAENGSQGEGAVGAALEQAIAKRTFGQKIALDLARADLKLTVAEFMVLRLLTALIGGGLGYIAGVLNAFGGMGLPLALAGAFLGYIAPGMYVGRRQSGRQNAFNTQLPDTITLLANGLRSGYSLTQAMDMLAREAAPPTSQEFGRVVAEVSLGLSAEEALNHLVSRVRSEDLDMMVTAMNVQREVGGNLATVLESIGHTIRERVRIKGDIGTLTSQAKGSAYVMSVLPVLIGLVIFLLNGDFMRPMFKGIFLCLPIAAGVMIAMGFFFMNKITDIKV